MASRGTRPSRAQGAAAGRPRPEVPVLLVHGILGQQYLYWNLFRRRLERDGFAVHEAILPRYLFGDLAGAAGQLAADVQRVLARRKASRLDLVCHSTGGVVARHFVQQMGGAAKVRRMVLMGVPHQGTQLSHLIPGLPMGRQIRPGSPFLGALLQKPVPSRVRVTNLWSPLDGVVVPGSHSRLPARGHANVSNVKTFSHHWGYLVSRRIYDRVRQALLESGRPAPRKRRLPAKRALPPTRRRAGRQAAVTSRGSRARP